MQRALAMDRLEKGGHVLRRDQIGELVIESINTKGESPNLAAMGKDKAARVNELLKDAGEYGQP